MFSYGEKKFCCQRGHGRFGQGINAPLSVSHFPRKCLKTVQSGVFFNTHRTKGGGGKFTPRPTFCCITPEP